MSSIFDFLPEDYRNSQNTIIRGLAEAIKAGDDHVLSILAQARSQLFLNTAYGAYLTNLANQYGFAVPANSGLDQNGFRSVALPAIWAPKQSIPTLNKMIELFYSTSVLHPGIVTEALDTFDLNDRDDLLIETEDGIKTVLFEADKFADITQLTASEVASTVNAQTDGLYADTVLDRVTGKYRVRIVSLNFGSAAKIRIRGGSAQNILRFQTVKDTHPVSGTVWNIDKFANAEYSSVVRFTWDGTGTDPKTFNLDIGDLVSIRGLQDVGPNPFSLLNGSYEVLDAGIDYFEIRNTFFQKTGVSLTQPDSNTFLFSSKDFRTLFNNEQYAVVSETAFGTIDVSIPAIPPIVRRPLRGATRLRGADINVIDINPGQFVVEYPNSLPASGTFIFHSDRFMYGFKDRYFKYSSKNPPVGNTQVLNLDTSGKQLPFLNAVEAGTALDAGLVKNPIFVEIDESEIHIQTPPVKHNFEHAQEIKIDNGSVAKAVFKHNTVRNILCPVGQDTTWFEHDMDTEYLYMQFYDEATNELYILDYYPDSADPINRTRIEYLPELEGKFIRAVMCTMNPVMTPGDPTQVVGPVSLNPSGGTALFNHNTGTPLTIFMVADTTDKKNLHAFRKNDSATTAEFTYHYAPSGMDVNAYCMDFQTVDPDLTRVIATNVNLPASPSSETTVQVVHNLFSSNLIVELKVRPSNTMGFPDDNFLFFPRVFLPNDTKLEIKYNGTTGPLTVDVYIMASYMNPIESVDGNFLSSEINNYHVVRRLVDSYDYTFEILGTGPALEGIGTITSAGKTVTGSGTQFTDQVQIGDHIVLPNGQGREVEQILSDTQLVLTTSFSPSVLSPSTYKVAGPDHNGTPVGEPVKYYGAVIYGFNVTYDPDTARGTDIRFEFSDRVSRANAGFIDGSRIQLMEFGSDIQPVVAKYLKSIYLTVHSQEDKYVFFNVGIGAAPGNIIVGAKARRTGNFGGEDFIHYMEKPLSSWNQNVFFKNKKILLLDNNIIENPNYAGSYMYDTVGTYAPYVLSSQSCVLLKSVRAFDAPGLLEVDQIQTIPNSGYLFLDFGNTQIEGPIKYTLTIPGSPNQIRLDPAYVFKKSHSQNAVVRIARSINKLELLTDGSQFPMYITGAVEARRTLEAILKDMVSVGVKLNIQLQLPDIRFYEESIQPFV